MEIAQLSSPIGPRIERALKRYNFERDADLTWKDLGQKVWDLLQREKVDTSKVSRIKNGEQEPTIAEGGAFAYLLDVSPLWLFWEIGDMGRFPNGAQLPSTELQRETTGEVTREDLGIQKQG